MHVALEQRQIGGVRLRQQQIQEPPSHPRRAFDELHVLGAKHHHPHGTQVVTQLAHHLIVEAQFSLAGGPIHFDVAHGLADDACADEITLLLVPDHLGAADAAKGPQGGEQVDGLEDVRLALGIFTQQKMKTGSEIHVQARIIAEIEEP